MTNDSYQRFLLSALLIISCTFVHFQVQAVDDVHIYDEFNNRYSNGGNAFVVQRTNHTFQCLATNIGPIVQVWPYLVQLRWELFDGSTGSDIDNDNGYPRNISNKDDPMQNDMLGQVSVSADLRMTDYKLRCRVEDNRIIDQYVVLKVLVPPKYITMSDYNEPGGYTTSAVATVTQDSEHSMHCLVQATLPTSDFTWTLDGTPLPSNEIGRQNQNDYRMFDTTSTISFVPQRSHNKKYLECRASINVPDAGNFPSSPISNRVQLHVIGPPDKPVIDVSPGSLSQKENQAFNLTCRATNAYPAASLRWFLDNVEITSYARETIKENNDLRYKTTSTLTYTPTRANNKQQVRCDAYHSTLTYPFQTISYEITITFCPSSTQACPSSLVVGDIATLTCKSSSSNPKSSLFWYVNGEESSSNYPVTQTQSDYNGWTTEQTFTSPPLTLDDVGIRITCCANVTSVEDCSSCSMPCQPQVYYAPIFKEISVPQNPQQEGKSVQLSCVVMATPQPDGFVKMQLDDTDIDGGVLSESSGNERTFIYNIQSVGRRDAGIYTCVADNGIGISNSQALNLIVQFCPSSTTTFSETRSCPSSLVVGDTATLTCKSSSSNPKSSLFWYVNGEERLSNYPVTETPSDYHGWTTEQTFTTRPLTLDDVGIRITCCANVTSVEGCSSCSMPCQPQIYYAPIFKRTSIPQDPQQEGNSVEFSCVVMARPQPDGFVKMQLDGTDIDGGVLSESSGNERTFIYNIQSVGRRDAGLYTCVADNGIGISNSQARSQALNLTVHYGPIALDESYSHDRPTPVQEGTMVTFSATIRSNPISVVKWTSPTGPIPPNGDEHYGVETTMIEPDGYEDDVRGTTVLAKLVVKSVSRSNDTDKFTCNVTNIEGYLPVTFTIEIGTVPCKPTSFQVVHTTDDEMTLQWSAGDDRGFPQQFWVSCGRINKVSVGQDTTFNVTGLESNTPYRCEVYGQNDAGDGEVKSVEDITNPSPPSVLGVDVIFNGDSEELVISGVSNTGLNICVQIETRENAHHHGRNSSGFPTTRENGTWIENGPCHLNDTTQNITGYIHVRAKTCSTIPPHKCSIPELALEDPGVTDDNGGTTKDIDWMMIIYYSAAAAGVFVFFITVVVVVICCNRRRSRSVNIPKVQAKDTEAETDSFDDDDGAVEAVKLTNLHVKEKEADMDSFDEGDSEVEDGQHQTDSMLYGNMDELRKQLACSLDITTNDSQPISTEDRQTDSMLYGNIGQLRRPSSVAYVNSDVDMFFDKQENSYACNLDTTAKGSSLSQKLQFSNDGYLDPATLTDTSENTMRERAPYVMYSDISEVINHVPMVASDQTQGTFGSQLIEALKTRKFDVTKD